MTASPAEPLEDLSPGTAATSQPQGYATDPFAILVADWDTRGRTLQARAACQRWATASPAFADFPTPTQLVRTINQPGDPAGSCSLLAELLVLADHDQTAARAVLQAILPGLRQAVRRRWQSAAGTGPWQAEPEVAAEALSAAWEAIHVFAGQIHRRPARLIIRRAERRLRTLHLAELRTKERVVALHEAAVAWDTCPIPLDNGDDQFVSDLLSSLHSRQLDPTTADVAFRVAVLDQPVAAAGRHHRLDPRQTRAALRLALHALTGDARAPTTETSPQEDQSMPRINRRQPGRPTDDRAESITPLLVTVDQAARLLGISRSKLYELLRAGDINSVTIGTRRRIPYRDLVQYVDQLRRAGTVRPAADRASKLMRADRDRLLPASGFETVR